MAVDEVRQALTDLRELATGLHPMALSRGGLASAVRSLADVAVVIGQLEIPQAVTAAAFQAAHEVGAATILNPAPAATLDAGLLEKIGRAQSAFA